MSKNVLMFSLIDGLTKLNHVDLEYNKCINQQYHKSTDIIQFNYYIKTKCFNSIEITSTTTQNTIYLVLCLVLCTHIYPYFMCCNLRLRIQ